MLSRAAQFLMSSVHSTRRIILIKIICLFNSAFHASTSSILMRFPSMFAALPRVLRVTEVFSGSSSRSTPSKTVTHGQTDPQYPLRWPRPSLSDCRVQRSLGHGVQRICQLPCSQIFALSNVVLRSCSGLALGTLKPLPVSCRCFLSGAIELAVTRGLWLLGLL
jgi:hypothetical protein